MATRRCCSFDSFTFLHSYIYALGLSIHSRFASGAAFVIFALTFALIARVSLPGKVALPLQRSFHPDFCSVDLSYKRKVFC